MCCPALLATSTSATSTTSNSTSTSTGGIHGSVQLSLLSVTVQLAICAVGQRERHLCRASVSLLAQLTRAARVALPIPSRRGMAAGAEQEQLTVQLQQQYAGAVSARVAWLIRAVLFALADTMPPESIPRAADVLGPVLHLPCCREPVAGAVTGGVRLGTCTEPSFNFVWHC